MAGLAAAPSGDPDRAFDAIARVFGPSRVDEETRRLVRSLLREATMQDIPTLERRLSEGGVGAATLNVLRDVRRWLGSAPCTTSMPPGHPIDLLRRENAFIAERMDVARRALSEEHFSERLDSLRELTRDLFDLSKHYARRSCCCDMLRSHGLTGLPDALLDDESTTLRGLDGLHRLSSAPSPSELGEARATLTANEAKILFEDEIFLPLCCAMLTEADWERVHWTSRRYGCCPTGGDEEWLPGVPCLHDGWMPLPPPALIHLDGGALTAGEIEPMLQALPFDISFIDAFGRIRYRNFRAGSVHGHSRAVIGRLVGHGYTGAEASTIQGIIAGFRGGTSSCAEMALGDGQRTVRYLALRDAHGIYQGALEIIEEGLGSPTRVAAPIARA